MVKLYKTLPLPKHLHIQSHKDWGYGTDVHRLLEDDCFGKCYICENKPKERSSLTVEHVESRDFAPKRVYDWENLLLACERCNTLKDHSYNNIINPSVYDPEELLAFGLTDDLRQVDITCLSTCLKAKETKQLLEVVYNDKRRNDVRLLSKLLHEIQVFNYYLECWQDGEEAFGLYIREALNRSSEFAAFKRKIVRDDPQLMEQFGDALV